jgi:hypothetical protein
MVDTQLGRLPRGEAENQFAGAGAVLEVACECGRSGCGEVIALPLCVYRQAHSEPQRLVLAPGHELPDVGSAVSRYDSFVVAAKK